MRRGPQRTRQCNAPLSASPHATVARTLSTSRQLSAQPPSQQRRRQSAHAARHTQRPPAPPAASSNRPQSLPQRLDNASTTRLRPHKKLANRSDARNDDDQVRCATPNTPEEHGPREESRGSRPELGEKRSHDHPQASTRALHAHGLTALHRRRRRNANTSPLLHESAQHGGPPRQARAWPASCLTQRRRRPGRHRHHAPLLSLPHSARTGNQVFALGERGTRGGRGRARCALAAGANGSCVPRPPGTRALTPRLRPPAKQLHALSLATRTSGGGGKARAASQTLLRRRRFRPGGSFGRPAQPLLIKSATRSDAHDTHRQEGRDCSVVHVGERTRTSHESFLEGPPRNCPRPLACSPPPHAPARPPPVQQLTQPPRAPKAPEGERGGERGRRHGHAPHAASHAASCSQTRPDLPNTHGCAPHRGTLTAGTKSGARHEMGIRGRGRTKRLEGPCELARTPCTSELKLKRGEQGEGTGRRKGEGEEAGQRARSHGADRAWGMGCAHRRALRAAPRHAHVRWAPACGLRRCSDQQDLRT